jgi:hypothetical protein
MFMKQDYLKTSVWYKEPIDDPYQLIAEFFDSADIAYYRKHIKSIIQTAGSYNCWKKKDPGYLMDEFRLLESIINAAYLLNHQKKKDPLCIDPEDVFDPNLFVGWGGEFANPYLVFKRFFRFQELAKWKQDLQCLLDYSLRSLNILEEEENINLFGLHSHLTKLVEAAHLIDVREVNHIGGRIKRRMEKTRL